MNRKEFAAFPAGCVDLDLLMAPCEKVNRDVGIRGTPGSWTLVDVTRDEFNLDRTTAERRQVVEDPSSMSLG